MQALDLGHDDLDYVWKLVMVAVGIYIFFLLECIMKMYLYFKHLEVSVFNAALKRDLPEV
jgi:hypothetical protein